MALAVFFDGTSSKPTEVQVELDHAYGTILFSSAKVIHKWEKEDFTPEKVNRKVSFRHITSDALLHVDDPVFLKEWEQWVKTTGQVSLYDKLITAGTPVHIVVVLAILGFILAINQYVLPEVAERAVVVIPEYYDNQLGSSFFEEFIDFQDVDTAKTELLRLFAQEINLNNSKALNFTLVESSLVNAFALPDGNIVVFSGILKQMQGYEELAALLGHEASHVNNRHSMKMTCRNLAGFLFISVIMSDVNGIMAVIADNVTQIQSLSFSRAFEREADNEGLDILVSNNINPKGMSNLFERLHSRHDYLVPEFLSSHPVTTERIAYIDDRIAHTTHETVYNCQLHELFLAIKK